MNRFGNKLAKDVLIDEYFIELNVKAIKIYSNPLFDLDDIEEYTDKEFIDILRFIDILSNSVESESRNKAYSLISLLHQRYKRDTNYLRIAYAVFIKLGLFVACELLTYEAELPFDREFEENLKRKTHITPDGNKLFTDSQYELFTKLYVSNSFSFSGPTSMGKSFLIQKFIEKQIIDKKVNTLVIIVPSRALIMQFSQELNAEFGDLLKRNNFRIFTNSNITKIIKVEDAVKYVFVLTPERLHSYLSQNDNPIIDILFVDEAHKLASNDSRSITEYSAIDIALEKNPKMKLFFSSPNIANPEVFLELFNRFDDNSFSTIEAPVAQNFYVLNTDKSSIEYIETETKTEILNNSLECPKDILTSIYKIGKKEQSNIIYCTSPDKALDSAREFSNLISDVDEDCLCKEVIRARKILKEYIHKDYFLREFLKKGIAYHHGKLPQIVRNIVEELFRHKKIKFLFCTSTLLEGVNLPAKNMFIIPGMRMFKASLDKNNENAPLKIIDFWNLAGRAGRFKKEFSGNVFCYQNSKNDVGIRTLKKEQVEVIPLIQNKVEKKLNKIEVLLRNGDIDSDKEQKILEYIANIICIDTIRFENYNASFLLSEFIKNNNEKILKLAKERAKIIKDIPVSVLSSYQSLGLKIQKEVYDSIKSNPKKYKLPKVTYENILNQLNLFSTLYLWKDSEPSFNSRLKYLAFLMNKWISDESLSSIIKDRLQNKDSLHEEIRLIKYKKDSAVPFNINDPFHVNIEINNLLVDIESLLRFSMERYFNHYHQLLVHFLGEDKAGFNWATFLEYGTKYPIVIALQNIGLSRYVANSIFKNFKNYLNIDKDDLLIGYDKVGLLKEMNKESDKYYIEIDEICKVQ